MPHAHMKPENLVFILPWHHPPLTDVVLMRCSFGQDMNKPDGITVVTPDMADEFIDRLPIRKFFGIGKIREEKMLNLGIKTGADLKKYNKEQLILLFGKSGSYFFDIAHGLDERTVEPNRIRKSITIQISKC